MDTPERNQIAKPISKFEDSPVFNYISSLSPIKPVKSLHIAQTLSSLTFASLPSVFTSPHVISHKESRFLRRNQHSDPSKPECSSGNGTKICANEGVSMDAAQMYDNSAELQENFDPDVSIGETHAETAGEHYKFPIELPRALKYDCGSPDYGPTPCSPEMKSMSHLAAGASTLPVENASEKGSCEDEMHIQNIRLIEQKKEKTACDWENLISDAADLLIFNSHSDTEAFEGLIQKPQNCGSRFGTSIMSQFQQEDIKNVQKILLVNREPSGEHHLTDETSYQPGEAGGLEEIHQPWDLASTNPNECMACNLNEETDNEPVLNLHRGIRRRCLDFEMVGARRNNLHGISSCRSTLSQSDEMIASNNKQLVPIRAGRESSRCILPGIGLHLNALTATSKDYKSIKQETLSSGRQLLPCSTSNFHSHEDGQESFHKSLILAPFERDTDPAENGVQLAEDASHSSANLVTEELNQNSPKKKRRRLEDHGESEGCKRCNCKKTKCLKLYCECFAAGVYCIEPCSCQDCFNKPNHEDTVLATRKQIESRNPLAFAPKVIRSADSIPEIGDESSKTPASARHKRGCNCKKSSCLKKYCECYQGGVGCSINCRCEGCKNVFGIKDGSAVVGAEAEPGEEEADTFKTTMVDKATQKTEVQNPEEHNSISALPVTPLQSCRPSIHLPFQSSSKPPRFSFPNIGSASGLYGRPNIIRSQSKLDRHFQASSEDEMPDILRGNCSPTSNIKTVSPNSKRISPPHCTFGSSPRRTNGRKLKLQSIPSFPSLTPHH